MIIESMNHRNFIGLRWQGDSVPCLTKCTDGELEDLDFIPVDGVDPPICNDYIKIEAEIGWAMIEADNDAIRLFHGGAGESPVWVSLDDAEL